MYQESSRKAENNQVCDYLIGKIDNDLINRIKVEDYQLCKSRNGATGALIINFTIKSGEKNEFKPTSSPFKRT